jgi:hypothetical protein
MPLNLKSIRIAGIAALATFFLASALSAAPPAKSITSSGPSGLEAQASTRSTELLKDLQIVSSELNRHAETLGAFANRRGELSWQSHATYLTGVRESINEAGLMIKQLQDMRHAVAPWQQRAIDRIHPVALQLADHTEAAIEHLNEYQGSLWMPEYTERLTSIADHASDMKATVDNFVDYGKTQQKIQDLQNELELASS